MATVQSAWHRYPDYRIDLVPSSGTARVWHGDVLLAESDRAIRLEETRHVDRLYFPMDDVRWEHLTETDHHTICPFKGECDYWSVIATDPPEENAVWAYRTPFKEVAGIKGYVAFYHERLRVEIDEQWPGDARARTVNRFPTWGTAADLTALIDVAPDGGGRFVSPAYRIATRNVVEGGQMLAEAIVAAAKTIPDQRVTSASMIFSKAASFDAPHEVAVDVMRRGRTFSTLQVRFDQHESMRAVGLLLLDSGSPDVIRHGSPMPLVPAPYDCPSHNFGVTGRDIRIVDGAYDPNPDRVGTPEIYAWVRFRDAPAHPYLHTALMAQSTTHWTIAANMRPHKGFGEADAHVTLSTGIMSVSMAFHEEVDVTEWLLYANPGTYAGNGLVHGEGRVFTESGRHVASYSVQAMVRAFVKPPDAMGMDATNAM